MMHTGTLSCLTLLRRRNAAREQSLPKAAKDFEIQAEVSKSCFQIVLSDERGHFKSYEIQGALPSTEDELLWRILGEMADLRWFMDLG